MTTLTIPSVQELEATGRKLLQLKDELAEIFPEREELITQIIYALATREHVLVWGPYGTGKSDLVHTLFEVFQGARKFSIGLSKFMTESNIIGIPDPKKMREDGQLVYQRDGGILDAEFVELDEIFDASAPLLRTLLGILNERQFKRGRQLEYANLHTAIGSTNGEPGDQIRQASELGAVVDRFLFQCRVEYIKEPENRRKMYRQYLTGVKPHVQIDYDDLRNFSGAVTAPNQITDPYFIEVYDKLIEGYKSANHGQVVSDRRAAKLFKLVEANALLYGRHEVVFEDLNAVKWGLCQAGDTAQQQSFDHVAEPIITEANAQQQQSIDEVQIQLLHEFEQKIPVVPPQATPEQLVNLRRELNVLMRDIENVKPKLGSTDDLKRKTRTKVDGCIKQVDEQING